MLPKSGKAKAERKAFIIIGSPASGKSGIASKISDEFDAYVLDSDYIKRKIPEYNHNQNGASLVHEESKHILATVMPIILGDGWNVVYPVVGSDYKKFDSMIKDCFLPHNYQIYIILADLDRLESCRRALVRFEQTERYVSLPMILDEYSNNPKATFYQMVAFDMPYHYISVDTGNARKDKVIVWDKSKSNDQSDLVRLKKLLNK